MEAVVVISDFTKGRKVGVESGYQGDLGVRNSGHSSFLLCCFSGDGFGSGNGLLDPKETKRPLTSRSCKDITNLYLQTRC